MAENEQKQEEILIRILSTDIPGNMNVYSGLTKIKGISWSFSNVLCNKLEIDKGKKISDLSKEEINKIKIFVENGDISNFILNRRKDRETGENNHLLGSDLELKQEFNIKRLKKIRSYRGWRHATGRPARGQRTKGNFRKRKTVGVSKTARMKKAAGGSK